MEVFYYPHISQVHVDRLGVYNSKMTQTNQTPHHEEHSRLQWLDLVRGLGAFLVVLAHVEYTGGGRGMVAGFYYLITRTAVPLFFMASGLLLLGKNETYLDFFKKRAVKVFLPFVIWSVIYMVWQNGIPTAPISEIIVSFFVKILRGPRANHLWFFYELLGLYLLTPVLRILVQKAAYKDLFYFLGMWFVLTPLANLLPEFTPVTLGFEFYFLNGYIGYFVFGYLVGKVEVTRTHKQVAGAVFISVLAGTLFGMYLFRTYEIQSQYLESYLGVNVVLLSSSLFVLCKDLRTPSSFLQLISLMSRTSFGVYLVHVIVMTELFSTPLLSPLTTTGLAAYMIPLIGLLGYLCSVLLIVIFQKIPVIKFLVP